MFILQQRVFPPFNGENAKFAQKLQKRVFHPFNGENAKITQNHRSEYFIHLMGGMQKLHKITEASISFI